MNKDQFKVIYTGDIKENFDINLVAERFAKKFKLSPEKALKILQAGREVTLNKKAEHLKAYKLKSIFEEMGMKIRLQRLTIVAAVSNQNKEIETHDEAKDEQETSSQPSDSWSMAPITQDSETSTVNTDDSQDTIKQNNEPQKIIKDEDTYQNSAKVEYTSNNLIDQIKTFGGWAVGIFAGLFILIKKFGLLKLLKIGVVMAAASAIGFDPEEACMDNGRCEDDVDDQMDACWEDNGFDQIDWDNITAEEYLALKPRIENDFIACFLYQDTGERIFMSPIDLRIELMDYCDTSDIKNCNELVEPQIKGCFEDARLDRYFNENTTDYYAVFYQHPEAIENFYNCFTDEQGNTIINYDYE